MNNKSDETTFFVCPAVNILKQVSLDISEIKKKITLLTQSQSKILDMQQLLKEFKISRNTCCTWRNGGLAFIKKGRRIYFYREDVERFLSKHYHRGF